MDSSETSDGHDDKVDSLSAANTPIAAATPSGIHLAHEQLRLPIIQKRDQLVSTTLTLPSMSMIVAVMGESSQGAFVPVQHSIYSTYGGTNGFPFNDKTTFHSGDYTLGFIFETKEVADSIVGIRATLAIEPVSNLMVSQMIFGLYRNLGYEPSRTMRYPVVSTVEDSSFHSKIRTEVKKLSDRLNEISTKFDNMNSRFGELLQGLIPIMELKKSQESLLERIQEFKVTSEPTITLDQIREVVSATHHNDEKGSTENIIRVEEIEKIISEKQKYYDKLAEAEDYIEYLTSKNSHKSSSKRKY